MCKSCCLQNDGIVPSVCGGDLLVLHKVDLGYLGEAGQKQRRKGGCLGEKSRFIFKGHLLRQG